MEINGTFYVFDDDEEMYKLWSIQNHFRETGGSSKFIDSISSVMEANNKITYDQFEVVKKIYADLNLYTEESE